MACMDKKQTYRVVNAGKKAQRRDYSKVSGNLELPNLVEVQTNSYEWFKNEGIREVFEEIYPISNYGGNIKLRFIDYEFGKPKFNAEESMFRECNFAAPLSAKMELEITDNATGEVMTKPEDVYLSLIHIFYLLWQAFARRHQNRCGAHRFTVKTIFACSSYAKISLIQTITSLFSK